MRNKDVLRKLKNLPDNTKEYVDNLNADTNYNLSVVNNFNNSIFAGNRFKFFSAPISEKSYSVDVKKDDKDCLKRYYNINKALDSLTPFDRLFINIKYIKNGVQKTANTNTIYALSAKNFNKVLENSDFSILVTVVPDKQVNENLEEIDVKDKCYAKITFSRSSTEAEVKMVDNGYMELYVANSNILKLDNTSPYTPTKDYNPATKKYVDDLVEISKTAMCTDEEVDNMLNEVLGGDYSGN